MEQFVTNNRKINPKKDKKNFYFVITIILGSFLLIGTMIAIFFKQSAPIKSSDVLQIETADINSPTLDTSVTSLEEQLDSCVIRSLLILGVKPETAKIKRTKTKSGLSGIMQKTVYSDVPSEFPTALFNVIVHGEFRKIGGDIYDCVEVVRGYKLKIDAGYNGFITHTITLNRKSELKPSKGKVALFIRGFGVVDPTDIDEIFALKTKFSASIIPFTPFHEKSYTRLKADNRELFVALPMEPVDYPKNNPGEFAVYLRHSDHEIVSLTNKVLDVFPDAVGVTNHMGSAVMQDRRVMMRIFSMVKKRDLKFIDGHNIAQSICCNMAEEFDIHSDIVDVVVDAVDTAYAVSAPRFFEYALQSRLYDKGLILALRANESSVDILCDNIRHLQNLGVEFYFVTELMD